MLPQVLLCIDDRIKLLEFRKAVLEEKGYQVRTASSSYEALRMMDEEPPGAVLLEYKLEGMDAQAVAFHVKQRFPGVPIILLSAYSDMPEQVLWLVDEYLPKSECAEGLVDCLERAMRRVKTKPANKLTPASANEIGRSQSAA